MPRSQVWMCLFKESMLKICCLFVIFFINFFSFTLFFTFNLGIIFHVFFLLLFPKCKECIFFCEWIVFNEVNQRKCWPVYRLSPPNSTRAHRSTENYHIFFVAFFILSLINFFLFALFLKIKRNNLIYALFRSIPNQMKSVFVFDSLVSHFYQ